LLGGDSLASNAPLARVVAFYVTEEFLAEVAAEHRKGRRLLIGTTNLDAERQVIWDMGAIAVSREPESLELFRKMLLASAAIPAVFPPGFVKVAAEGGVYDEMHVDGGATRECSWCRRNSWPRRSTDGSAPIRGGGPTSCATAASRRNTRRSSRRPCRSPAARCRA
jgi:hypothetical protein